MLGSLAKPISSVPVVHLEPSSIRKQALFRMHDFSCSRVPKGIDLFFRP
jgi:hypothetical protein